MTQPVKMRRLSLKHQYGGVDCERINIRDKIEKRKEEAMNCQQCGKPLREEHIYWLFDNGNHYFCSDWCKQSYLTDREADLKRRENASRSIC